MPSNKGLFGGVLGNCRLFPRDKNFPTGGALARELMLVPGAVLHTRRLMQRAETEMMTAQAQAMETQNI
jgi:hypothetical protein